MTLFSKEKRQKQKGINKGKRSEGKRNDQKQEKKVNLIQKIKMIFLQLP